MRVCLYQKSVCKLHQTEGVYCRYIQYIGYKGLRQVYLYSVQIYGGLFILYIYDCGAFKIIVTVSLN